MENRFKIESFCHENGMKKDPFAFDEWLRDSYAGGQEGFLKQEQDANYLKKEHVSERCHFKSENDNNANNCHISKSFDALNSEASILSSASALSTPSSTTSLESLFSSSTRTSSESSYSSSTTASTLWHCALQQTEENCHDGKNCDKVLCNDISKSGINMSVEKITKAEEENKSFLRLVPFHHLAAAKSEDQSETEAANGEKMASTIREKLQTVISSLKQYTSPKTTIMTKKKTLHNKKRQQLRASWLTGNEIARKGTAAPKWPSGKLVAYPVGITQSNNINNGGAVKHSKLTGYYRNFKLVNAKKKRRRGQDKKYCCCCRQMARSIHYKKKYR